MCSTPSTTSGCAFHFLTAVKNNIIIYPKSFYYASCYSLFLITMMLVNTSAEFCLVHMVSDIGYKNVITAKGKHWKGVKDVGN